jgi:hypothetical protein
MQRAFLKNLLWLQLLNWLVKPLWILWIEREIQLRMGDSWYGVYTLHFNLVLLFAVLLDAGLNTYAAREIAANGKDALFAVGTRFGLRLPGFDGCANAVGHSNAILVARFNQSNIGFGGFDDARRFARKTEICIG